jgi:hypothetical protein
MGFSSQAGSVAFRTQATPTVFPADFATAAVAMKLKTGALSANRDLLIPDPEVGGGRDINDAFLGPVSFTGDYEFYARLSGITTLLAAGFGTRLSGPGGVNEQDTITKTGTWSGGTFTLTFNGQTTTAIPYNADVLTIQAALVALSNIAPFEVTVTGGPLFTTPIVITLDGTLTGTQATGVTITTTSVTGTTPGANVVRTVTGLTNTGTNSHLMVPLDSGTLPFVAIEENVGNGFDVFRYRDAVVNTLHFECDANGYLMGTAGMIARLQDAQASATDVSALFDNLDLIVGTNITVTFGGTSLAAKSFKFDFNNNFQADDFRLGSFFIGDLTAKRRECTVGVHIREQDKTLWRQATYGNSAATTPGGTIIKNNVVITASTYSFIPGSSPSLAYSLSLTMPVAAIKPYGLSVSGDDIMESDIEFQALRPSILNPLVRAKVVNGSSVVA